MGLLNMQLADDWCRGIIDNLEQHRFYTIKDGLLVTTESRQSRTYWRVAVPVALRAMIIDLYHEPTTSGHLGFDKTYQKLKERFIWPYMKKDIITYLQKCLSCKIHKHRTTKCVGKLKPINPFKTLANIRPGDFYSADLLGPFPVSSRGNNTVIVVTDVLTRYVIVGALKDATAISVAEFLMDFIVCPIGGFKLLLTDNGKCFIAKLMAEMAKHLGFKQVFTNDYSPEVNGLTERFNKTLAEMISHYIPDSDYTEWDKNLPAITSAHNTSVQKSLKEKPYYLFWGFDPVLPQDGALQLPTKSRTADLQQNV